MSKLRRLLAVVCGLAFILGGLTIIKLGRSSLKEGNTYSKAVFDDHGQLLRLTLSEDDKYRMWLPLREISPSLIEATLVVEDRHFRSHPGINPVSLLRAFMTTYLGGARRVGGS